MWKAKYTSKEENININIARTRTTLAAAHASPRPV